MSDIVCMVGLRPVTGKASIMYYRLEPYFDALRDDWTDEQINEAHNIIDTIMAVDSLRKKANRHINSGYDIPKDLIKTALRIHGQLLENIKRNKEREEILSLFFEGETQ